jgi:hypothetical protein
LVNDTEVLNSSINRNDLYTHLIQSLHGHSHEFKLVRIARPSGSGIRNQRQLNIEVMVFTLHVRT